MKFKHCTDEYIVHKYTV